MVECSKTNETDSSPLLGMSDEYFAKTSVIRMIFFVFIISLTSVVNGFATNFSAIALPQMHVNIDEASWFGSINTLGILFSSAYMGFVMDKFGRKLSILINVLPSIIGWFVLSRNFAFPTLLFGKFLTGFSCPYVEQVYIAETIAVNDHHSRSSYMTWSAIGMATGCFVTYVLARILPHYQNVAFVAFIISVIAFLFIIIFIPESPQWLCNHGHMTKAYVAEKRLRIRQPSIRNMQLKNDNTELSFRDWRNWLRKLKRKDVYKPTIITTVWMVLTNFNGWPAIAAYLVDIISGPVNQFPDSSIQKFGTASGYDASVVSSVFVLIGTILMSSFIWRTGIKRMYLFGSVGTIVSLCTLAISIELMKTENNGQFWNQMHVVAVWLLQFFGSLGVVFIPILILGEIFPSDARGFASITIFSSALSSGLAIKLHLYLYNYFDTYIYFIYAAINTLNLGFMYLFVRETVGKSLEEIGAHFSR